MALVETYIKKQLNELMGCLKPYTPDERLEMLLEAARTTGMKELEKAIIDYRRKMACRRKKREASYEN